MKLSEDSPCQGFRVQGTLGYGATPFRLQPRSEAETVLWNFPGLGSGEISRDRPDSETPYGCFSIPRRGFSLRPTAFVGSAGFSGDGRSEAAQAADKNGCLGCWGKIYALKIHLFRCISIASRSCFRSASTMRAKTASIQFAMRDITGS